MKKRRRRRRRRRRRNPGGKTDLPDDDVVNERGINASAINECIKDRSTEGDGVPLAETSVLLGTRGAYCADNVCVHLLCVL